MKKKRILNIVIYLILFLILICSGFKLYFWYKDKKNNDETIEQLKNNVKLEKIKNDNSNNEKYIVDFKKLKSENNDVVAYIKVNNTNIEYPIVKTSNNNFYLNHSFDKSKNSRGWIFADYKNKFDNTDKNIVIYGHNMRDGSMFGSLKNILNEEWYNNAENMNITFLTENRNYIYKVFSIYKIESEDYYIKTNFKNDADYEKFLNIIKNRSIKNFDVKVKASDKILTLSTCANNNKYRIVLHAKKL